MITTGAIVAIGIIGFMIVVTLIAKCVRNCKTITKLNYLKFSIKIIKENVNLTKWMYRQGLGKFSVRNYKTVF